MHLSRRICAVLIGLTALVGVTACGGGESASDDTRPTFGPRPDAAAGSDSSVPTFDGGTGSSSGTRSEAEFTKVPSTTVRFVNTYASNGTGAPVDVYWGLGLSSGKKVMTVPYGTISDPVTLEVEANPMIERSDGEEELAVSYYPEGATTGQPLGTSQQVLDEGVTEFVGVIAANETTTADGSSGASTQLGQLDGISAPPAGQAMVILNDLGVQAIDKGDFLTLSPQGQCDTWKLLNDIDSGNNGTAYAADPGAVAAVASDANTNCATGLPPVNLDLAAGKLVVLYAYGTTIADRKLLVLDAEK